jgi:molecular chaperone HscA
MALLQISEPGMSTAPHQHRLAVGIDLGTTNSLVATVRNSIPEVLSDEDGRPLLPSVVRYLPNGHANIGYKAQAAQTTDPKNTIVSVKRFMGRGLADIAYAENLPYDFVDAPGMVQLKTVAGVKSPVESAQILAAAPARGRLAGRRSGGCRHHRAGLLRRRPAPGHQGCGPAGRPERAAPAASRRRPRSPTASITVRKAVRRTIWAAAPSISHLKLSKGVFEVLSTGGDSALAATT